MAISRIEAIEYVFNQRALDPALATVFMHIAKNQDPEIGVSLDTLNEAEIVEPEVMEEHIQALIDCELVILEDNYFVHEVNGHEVLTEAAKYFKAQNEDQPKEKVKKEKKAKEPKPEKIQVSDADFKAVVDLAEETAKNVFVFQKIDPAKTRTAVRVSSKNPLNMRAFEIFRSGVFRLYTGGVLPEATVDFLKTLDVKIKEGNHMYYDVAISNAEAVCEHLMALYLVTEKTDAE